MAEKAVHFSMRGDDFATLAAVLWLSMVLIRKPCISVFQDRVLRYRKALKKIVGYKNWSALPERETAVPKEGSEKRERFWERSGRAGSVHCRVGSELPFISL